MWKLPGCSQSVGLFLNSKKGRVFMPMNLSNVEEYINSAAQRSLNKIVHRISKRRSLTPIKTFSPTDHPKFKELEKKLLGSVNEDFVTRLNYYINKKGMTHPQVYNTAGMTADCFSKIISGKTKRPTKDNIVALALALSLDYEEAVDLLSSAGHSLTGFKKDLIYEFCFIYGPFSIDEVNEALVRFHFNPIGGRK